MAKADEPPWEALRAPAERLRARTMGEAVLYLRVRGAAILGERHHEARGKHLVEVRVLHQGEEKWFAFELVHIDADDLLHLGGGAPSELLDPADLVLFSSRVERELPDSLEGLSAERIRSHLRDLDLAAEAADEATKFIPRREDRVPLGSMSTAAARWLYKRAPERFARDSLVALAQRLRRRAIWYQEALRLRLS